MSRMSPAREQAPPSSWWEAWPGIAGGAIGGFVVLAPVAPLVVALTGAAAAAVLGGILIYGLTKVSRDNSPPTAAE